MWKPSVFVTECMDKPNVTETVRKTGLVESLRIFEEPPQRAPAQPAPSVIPADQVIELSATALDSYLTCPLSYRFSRVVKIPVPMHHSQVFGVAVHEALKAYHLCRREGRKFSADDLLEAFKNAWRSEGFVSREHEDKRFSEGKKLLKEYFKKEEQSPSKPALVEEDFRITMNQVRLRGRWDRVDMSESGSAIIDYKTGEVKDQKDADKKARDSAQLSLYAVAFEGRFGKMPDRMELHFLKHGIIGTTSPDPKKVDTVLAKVQAAAVGVAQQKFDPTPGYHCRWCPYEKICPAENKGGLHVPSI